MSAKYNSPFYENEIKYADEVFLRQPFGDRWEETTWREAGTMARKLASGLLSLGLPPKSHIGLVSSNCREWIIADMAIMMAGYVSVPLYPSLDATQIREVIELGDVRAIFVGKVHNWSAMKDGIDKNVALIAFPTYGGFEAINEGRQWHEFINDHEPLTDVRLPELTDIWTIVFTSGTTGTPKGVVLTYGVLESTKELVEKNNILNISRDGDNRFFSFLPLNHIAERVVVEMTCFMNGGSISFSESLQTFAQNLRDVRPTIFFAVPRIWTKFQLGILSKVPQEQLDVLLADPATASTTAKNLRLSLGLDDCRGNLTGAAPIPQSIKDWFTRIGIEIHEGYGMTENCAITTVLKASDRKPGSVGRAQPGTELKIAPETSEILMRAPYMMTGYYKDEERSSEVIKDGWLHTGDEGRIDEEGYLYITGRVKDTFKTSKGKFIVPAPIEWEFSSNSDLEQICVMGLGCPQPIVLVQLSDIGKSKSATLIEKGIINTLSAVNKSKPNYQKISSVVITKEPWTVENGLITPTLKIKRSKMHETYKAQLMNWFETGQPVVWE